MPRMICLFFLVELIRLGPSLGYHSYSSLTCWHILSPALLLGSF